MVIGGNFSVAFGQPRRSIARLNTDGHAGWPGDHAERSERRR